MREILQNSQIRKSPTHLSVAGLQGRLSLVALYMGHWCSLDTYQFSDRCTSETRCVALYRYRRGVWSGKQLFFPDMSPDTQTDETAF